MHKETDNAHMHAYTHGDSKFRFLFAPFHRGAGKKSDSLIHTYLFLLTDPEWSQMTLLVIKAPYDTLAGRSTAVLEYTYFSLAREVQLLF